MASTDQSRSSRPKRKRTANIMLSKQDLQEYLDDGYTPRMIAKDFNVSASDIQEKMTKFAIRTRIKPKKPARSSTSPRAQAASPRRSAGGLRGGAERQSPRQSSREGARESPQRSPESSSEKEAAREEPGQADSDLNSVVVQVIRDNPDNDVDHIHAIVKSMGFDFDRPFVEDHMQRLGAEPKAAIETEDKKEPLLEKEAVVKRGRGRPRKMSLTPGSDKGETSAGEAGDHAKKTVVKRGRGRPRKSSLTPIGGKAEASAGKAGDHAKKLVGEPSKAGKVNEGEGEEKEQTVGSSTSKGDLSEPEQEKDSERKNTDENSNNLAGDSVIMNSDSGNGTGPESGKEVDNTEEMAETRPSTSRSPRVRRRPKKFGQEADDTASEVVEEEDASSMEMAEAADDTTEEFKEKPKKKRGRKRKEQFENGQPVMPKRGRPSLQLSIENIKHCINSGLTMERVAEVFGTCKRSISRYLELNNMRRRDRFCNISDKELDEMVAKVCAEHPDWGQITIQKHFEEKGMLLRRFQVRNSVRRVDPIGIELRKLNNLKRRWNRGSVKTLDRVLPADGINMTSTASFLSQAPRTGLNGLNEEDSVRLLKEIIYAGKRQYVEYQKKGKPGTSSEDADDTNDLVLVPPIKNEQGAASKQTPEALGKGVQGAEPLEPAEEGPPGEENTPPDENPQQENQQENEAEPLISFDGPDAYWKKRLHSMVMSNKRSGREAAAQRRGPAVSIPYNDLKQCVDLGYSSTRMADKFNTSKDNVRKYLDMYKLGKASRYERISDEALDLIVVNVMRQFNVLKGRQVYDKIREQGLQIRKDDIRKSLCRLHPKGLHRGSPTVLQRRPCKTEPGDAPSPYLLPQMIQENEGDVIVMDTDELAKLMNAAEGNIMLVDEQGRQVVTSGVQQGRGGVGHPPQRGSDRVEMIVCGDGTYFIGENVPAAKMAHAPATGDKGVVMGAGGLPNSAAHLNQSYQISSGTVTKMADSVPTVQQGSSSSPRHGYGPIEYQTGEEMARQLCDSQGRADVHLSRSAICNSPGTGNMNVHKDSGMDGQPGRSGSYIGQPHNLHQSQPQPQFIHRSQHNMHPPEPQPSGFLHSQTQPHSEPNVSRPEVKKESSSQEEEKVSAIILEFNVPDKPQQGGTVGPVQDEQASSKSTLEQADHMYILDNSVTSRQQVPATSGTKGGQLEHIYIMESSGNQKEQFQEVVLVEEAGDTQGGVHQGAEHIIMQLTGDTSSSSGSGDRELTSLNTVQPSQLSAQVLLELDRIAQNLQEKEAKPGEDVMIVSLESRGPNS